MVKPKLIRLIIYLVISIGLIILLVNIPSRESEKPKKKDTKIILDTVNGIPVDAPDLNDPDLKNPILVYIDSNHVFYLENEIIEKDSLEVGLQKLLNKGDRKAAFLMKLDKNVNSELAVFVLDLANKNKWKIGIATKN